MARNYIYESKGKGKNKYTEYTFFDPMYNTTHTVMYPPVKWLEQREVKFKKKIGMRVLKKRTVWL